MRTYFERWHFGILAAAVLALGACDGVEQTLPSGTASVLGSAVDVPFDFSAARSTALYETLADGTTRVDLNLCEKGCALYGNQVDPGSRAVLINLRVPTANLLPASVFTPATGVAAVAVLGVGEPDPLEEGFLSKVEGAVSGQMSITTLALSPGGAIRGTFNLQLERGGVLAGSFDAPLLQLQDGAPVATP